MSNAQVEEVTAPTFDLETHKNNLLGSIQVYRQTFRDFFFSDGVKEQVLKGYPGIDYTRLVASVQVFETTSEADESQRDYKKFQGAVSVADRMIAEYQEGYGINSDKGYCEMKYIYFPGLAYARALKSASNEADKQMPGSVRARALDLASKIILISMVGILNNLVAKQGINKNILRNSLVNAIIGNSFDRDLGDLGCYLIYKCVASAHAAAIASASVSPPIPLNG